VNFLTIRYVISMLEKLSASDRAELFAKIRQRFCIGCGQDLHSSMLTRPESHENSCPSFPRPKS